MGFGAVKLQPVMAQTSRPLAGRRIVVTRAREQAGDLVESLAALGADVVVAPTIRIEPLADLGPLRDALGAAARYQWIVFTSQNTVKVVWDSMTRWGLDASVFRGVPVAAIGPATADALAERGVSPALVPDRFVAEAVVEALAAREDLRDKRVLLPRAQEARDTLPEGLRARGATVDVIPVYRAAPEQSDGAALGAELLAGLIDAVTFTASSTVRNFTDLVGRDAATCGRFATAVIGPITAATARSLGIAVAVEAEQYTIPGLVDALTRYFSAPVAP